MQHQTQKKNIKQAEQQTEIEIKMVGSYKTAIHHINECWETKERLNQITWEKYLKNGGKGDKQVFNDRLLFAKYSLWLLFDGWTKLALKKAKKKEQKDYINSQIRKWRAS